MVKNNKIQTQNSLQKSSNSSRSANNKFKTTTSKITTSFAKTLTVLGVLGLTLGGVSLSILAQSPAQPSPQGGLGVMPTNSDPKNSQTKGWFLETVEAGKSVSRSAKIINTYKETKEVEIRAKDNIQTRDGGWDFRDNSSKDEFLGSWIKLEKDKVTVEGGAKNSEVKFDINVPMDTKPGEYGAVIAAQLPTVANNQGVAIENRVGSRIYLTVPGDLKMATKMDKFEFLSPKSQNYSQSISDKVAMQINFENVGNIFTKSFGKVTITTPKGNIEQVVDRDLAPRQSPFLFNFTTNEEWQVGKYKAKIELNNRPIINNKGEITDSSPIKTLETEIDLTQDIIDTIKKDRQNPGTIINQVATNSTPSTFQVGGEDENLEIKTAENKTSEPVKSESTKITTEGKNDSMTPILIGLGILGLIIIALLVFLVTKKSKKDGEEIKAEAKNVKTANSVNEKPVQKTVQAETIQSEKVEEKFPEQE